MCPTSLDAGQAFRFGLFFGAGRDFGDQRGDAGGKFHVDRFQRLIAVGATDRERERRERRALVVDDAHLLARRERQRPAFLAGGAVRAALGREARRRLRRRLARGGHELRDGLVGAAVRRCRLRRALPVEQVHLQLFERQRRRVLEDRGDLAAFADLDFAGELDAHTAHGIFGDQVEHQRRGERVGVLLAEVHVALQFVFQQRRLDRDFADLGGVRARDPVGGEALRRELCPEGRPGVHVQAGEADGTDAAGFQAVRRPRARLQPFGQRHRRFFDVGLVQAAGGERRRLRDVHFDVQAAGRARFVPVGRHADRGFERELAASLKGLGVGRPDGRFVFRSRDPGLDLRSS